MKANELMLGDWVLFYDARIRCDRYGIVEGIVPREGDYVPSTFTISSPCDPFYANVRQNDVKPVRLTAEILEKNERFIKVGANLWAMPYLGKWKLFVGIGNDTLVPNSEGVTVYVYYVHTLQHALRLCGLNELADNFKVK